ncbi:MAG TPA: hypothetical protein VD772_08295, partial [Anseongella sp.]|nr:hypothetical protein [Anseongella sp.]
YKSIGAQLTVRQHGAKEGRGNFIDHIDMPLNDSPWLLARLAEIEKLPAAQRSEQLRQLLHRTDPGPGGFYDHFGDPASWYRILPGAGREEDPGTLRSPRESFNIRVLGPSEREARPKAWLKQAGALYDLPLKIRYGDLDTEAAYRMRITYTGRFKSHVKLSADGEPVHGYLLTGEQPVYEFDVPQAATADGEVTFTWDCMQGERGLQVTEIWIIRKQD